MMGLRVFTLPAIISGYPVYSETSVTGMFLSFRSFAVPPVEMISISFDARTWANSIIPDLSETLISARFIGIFLSLEIGEMYVDNYNLLQLIKRRFFL